jgi:hypothetical protein
MKNNMLPNSSSNNNSFVQAQNKAEDPLIKAEIEKNLKEQRKIMQQDLVRSLEDIDKNFGLKKKEIQKQTASEIEQEISKWNTFKKDEEKRIKQEHEREID